MTRPLVAENGPFVLNVQRPHRIHSTRTWCVGRPNNKHLFTSRKRINEGEWMTLCSGCGWVHTKA